MAENKVFLVALEISEQQFISSSSALINQLFCGGSSGWLSS